MLATWALALGLGLSPSPLSPAPPLLPWRHESDPRVSVWTDREGPYRRGDAVCVFASTRISGYLTVLRIDTDGGLRVLFPREPWEDTWIRGGRVVEVDDGGPGGFAVDDYPGVGYLFAITSTEPFDYSSIERRDQWDYREIANGRIHGDPYVALTDLAERIAPGGGYDYDVTPYYVQRHYDYPRFVCYDCHTYAPYSGWDPYGAACPRYRIVIYDDPYYYPYQAYGGRVVVPGRPARLQPRYVFEDADGRSAWVTRARRPPAQPQTPAYRERAPDRQRWPAQPPDRPSVRERQPESIRRSERLLVPTPPKAKTPVKPEVRDRKPERSAPPPGDARRHAETEHQGPS